MAKPNKERNEKNVYLADAMELASLAVRWPVKSFNNPASMACR